MTTVIIHPELSVRDKNKIIDTLLESGQKLKIVSISDKDAFYYYQELIGLTGRFTKHDLYRSIFSLDTPIPINIGGSCTTFKEMFFTGVTLELV
jgi:hypothetical protein